MVTRSTTIERTVEIEVKAVDEESARAKAEKEIEDALTVQASNGTLFDDAFEWEETDSNDTFEYEASEG